MSGALQPIPESNIEGDASPPDADTRPSKRAAEDAEFDDEEDALRELINDQGKVPSIEVQAPPGTVRAKPTPREKTTEPAVDDGVLAALARLREAG
jgi:hypothetical protein